MNFYVSNATLDDVDLQPGDIIGVFDGNLCVGVGVLTEVLTGSNLLPLSNRVTTLYSHYRWVYPWEYCYLQNMGCG